MADDTSTYRTVPKQYDYLLKFLLVGDSDVGKQEILAELDDGSAESPFCGGSAYKTTVILLDGKRVKLQLWDASGQGRFCTIIRSYSRGAQGVLLVYDITSRWSFDSLDRWLREVDDHAPGVPKVLVGNRLHLEFRRRVPERDARHYAQRHRMAFFEVSSLCNYNVVESFKELSRMALQRNGMERLWRSNKVLTLQELCCRAIVARTTVYGIERLPLPQCVKSHLKSYALTSTSTCSIASARHLPVSASSAPTSSSSSSNGKPRWGAAAGGGGGLGGLGGRKNGGRKFVSSTPTSPADAAAAGDDAARSCVPRNSCTLS